MLDTTSGLANSLGLKRIAYLAAYLLLLGWATGCSFDDDPSVVPKFKAGFFLVQDTATESGQRYIWHYTPELGVRSWESVSGGPLQAPGALAIERSGLWVAERVDSGYVRKYDPASSQLVGEVRPGFRPGALAIGDKLLLVCSANNRQIALYEKDELNRIPYILELDGRVTEALYANGKFYLCCADSSLRVLNEEAYALAGIVRLPEVPFQAQLNRFANIEFFVVNANRQLEIATLETNGYSVSGESRRLNAIKRLITPYVRSVFGTELTRNVELTTAREAQIGDTRQRASDIWVDFTTSRYFVQNLRRDTLQVHGQSGQKLDAYPFPFQILDARFWVD